MIARLRASHLENDDAFDRMYPEWARRLSRGNWTALPIARRAVEHLVPRPGARVLDLGSGVGKLCLVGAMTTPGIFHGVEQREHFVVAARAAAARLGLDTVRFTCADATTVDMAPYDSLYLFNPFAEYYDKLLEPFDAAMAIDRAHHARLVGRLRHKLANARPGTRVVTYNGFGGDFPAEFRLVHAESADSDRLEVWTKTS